MGATRPFRANTTPTHAGAVRDETVLVAGRPTVGRTVSMMLDAGEKGPRRGALPWLAMIGCRDAGHAVC